MNTLSLFGFQLCFYEAVTRKQRLDLHLLTLGLAASRQQAQQMIRAGKVRDRHGQRLEKPGYEVAEDTVVRVEQPPRFVSRGGEKLLAALQSFPIEIKGRVCLDGGISTGGFTDCLLQHGARRVYGIDVGYGQTAWSLRTDERVVLKERTNLRRLIPEELFAEQIQGPHWPLLMCHSSPSNSCFRPSPACCSWMTRVVRCCDCEAVLLVKPQFEVGRDRVGKGGVVRDPAAHVDAIATVIAAGQGLDWRAQGLVGSPITGPAGNHEYLLWLSGTGEPSVPNAVIEGVVTATINR